MSFRQKEKLKDHFFFFKCYIAIENITSVAHWFCCCKFYFHCQTIHNFLRDQKKCCCYCQFKDSYNLSMLHDVKKDFGELRIFFYGILDKINRIKISRNLDCSASNFDILCLFGYVEDASEQRKAELKDFIFYYR